MKLQDVIDRALIDANFAEELKTMAMLGQRAGKGSPLWAKFIEHFANTPEELKRFTAYDREYEGCTATIMMTTTVTSTQLCTFTTTTTTTSIFCGEPHEKSD